MLNLRLYELSRALLRKSLTLIETVFNAFWLGVLSRKSLLKIDAAYYNKSDLYYTPEYNKKGLSKWEREMVERYFHTCKNLLLIGAGGGREVYALQNMGYVVDAFECNTALQEFGNKFLAGEGLTPCINAVEPDACPTGDSDYDGAIIGWGAYTLIQGANRRIDFLRSIHSQITEDANILLSFFTRGGDNWQIKNTALIGNIIRFLLRREHLEIGDSLAPNYVHYFTESELSEELEKAGFELLYYSSKSYGHAVGRSRKANAYVRSDAADICRTHTANTSK